MPHQYAHKPHLFKYTLAAGFSAISLFMAAPNAHPMEVMDVEVMDMEENKTDIGVFLENFDVSNPDWQRIADRCLEDYERHQSLNLAYISLNQIPKEITNLKNLTELKINGKKLACFPDSICNLKQLKTLVLVSVQFTSLPANFVHLTNLTTLSIGINNKLIGLPDNFGNMINLTTMVLGNCLFTTLPYSFGYLKNLRRLEIYGNKMTFLPYSFSKLSNLKILTLGDNKLKNRPEEIKVFSSACLTENEIAILLNHYQKRLSLSVHKFFLWSSVLSFEIVFPKDVMYVVGGYFYDISSM